MKQSIGAINPTTEAAALPRFVLPPASEVVSSEQQIWGDLGELHANADQFRRCLALYGRMLELLGAELRAASIDPCNARFEKQSLS